MRPSHDSTVREGKYQDPLPLRLLLGLGKILLIRTCSLPLSPITVLAAVLYFFQYRIPIHVVFAVDFHY
jgi:hypothetical protein